MYSRQTHPVQGLMHWTQESGLRVVANRISKSSKLAPGRVLSYTNSAAVSPTTGKVYFTSSGDIPPPYARGEYDTKAASGMTALTVLICRFVHVPCRTCYDLLPQANQLFMSCAPMQNHREGVLMEFDPVTGETNCLVDGLYFANGVDVAADGTYLVFAETFTNMVFKLSLSGPQVRHFDPAWRTNMICDTGKGPAQNTTFCVKAGHRIPPL